MEQAQPIVHDFTPSPIEQPPLNNNKSCLRRVVVIIFTLTLLIIIAFTLIGLFFNKPTIQRLPQLPPHFPTDIPLYRFSDRVYINYLNAEQNNRLIRRLALMPRFILGPVVFKINPDLTEEEKILNNNVLLGDPLTWSNLQNILTRPADQNHIDKIEIGWENIDDTPKKVYDFYKKNFTEQDYKVIAAVKTAEEMEFSFAKDKINGDLSIKIQNKEINKIILKVEFPSQEK